MCPTDEMESAQGGTAEDRDGQLRLGMRSLWMENRAKLSASVIVQGKDHKHLPWSMGKTISTCHGQWDLMLSELWRLSLMLRVWGTLKRLWERQSSVCETDLWF